MLKKITRIALFSSLCCIIVTAVWAQEFRFTSTADMTDHDDGLRDILNQIKNLVGDEGAFHIVPGDFDWDGTFPTLRAAFGNDVIWIPAIGNHDGDDKSQVKSHNQALPFFDINWGPRSCDQYTTFSFDYNNAHFIILDVYCADSGGDIDNTLYAWLSDDLHATQQPAIFVVGHEPAYPHYRHVGGSLDDNSSHRDRFWQLLHDTGVVAYICGHTHDPEIHEEPGYDTLQVDVGQARGTGSHDAFVDFIVKDSEVEIKVYQGSGSFHLSDHRIVPIEPSTPPGPPYDLTVNTEGQGSVAVSPHGGSYDVDTVVTLTASPSAGWMFNHWEGDLSGAVNHETITMNSHKTVTAIFIMDPDQMPVASFIATPSSGDAPLFVIFDAIASYDPDGDIDFYAWDFGDGGIGSGITASHEYNIPGIYTVTLTVTDSVGINNTATKTVTVGGEELIEVRVSASNDDAEEKSSGSVGTSSSDLELVYDGSDQTVGMRFNGATIPQGAAITNAYIQFQVDETNSGATSLTIQGQNIGNAPTFSTSSGNISSRAKTTASVSWNPVPWTTTGQAGPDQQTPDIARVIQEIVNRSDWWSGNSLVIIITGTGERTAESYNGSSSGAPLLHVEYFASGQPPVDQPPSASIVSPDNGSTVFGTVTIKVDASDAEDPVGTLGVEVQIDGGIWQSATYNSTSGYYELFWDTAAEGGGSYTIGFQATDSSGNTTNVSDAVRVTVSTQSPPVASFTATPSSGDAPLFVYFDAGDSKDPDGTIVSYEWHFGDNGSGSGITPSHTYNTPGSYEVTLTVTDNNGATDTTTETVTVAGDELIEVQVSASSDDAEESQSGSVSRSSSDLELVRTSSNQTVGMRFNGTTIPQGAAITNAYIQFHVDETDSEATSLAIQGQDISNAPSFSSSSGNISSRAKTTASVPWEPVPWTQTGQAGPAQQTPDIAPVIQEIVNQLDWSSGNSLVIIITGTGKRVAESYNGSSSGAPLLHVEYTTGPAANQAPNVDAGSNQTITLPDSATLDGSVSDDGLPSDPGTVTTTWSTISGPGTVTFGNANMVDTTATFSVDGTYVLQLDAYDGDLTSNNQVTVIVNPEPVNQAPVVGARQDQTITLPESAILDGSVTDDGLPSDPGVVTTTWSKVSGPGTVTFGNANMVDTTASFSTDGTYVLRLTANDGQLAPFDELTITVNPQPSNQAPTVDAGLDQTVTLPNSATLDGTVIDDGLPSVTLTITWSQVNGPGTVSFADTSAVDTTASFPAEGTYTLQLTANDGQLTSFDELTVTVNPAVTQVDTIEIRVETGYDDAEEKSSGSISRSSSDLELVYDGGNQKVGMRFNGATIPWGATITNAYIQFQVDETNSGATSLTIQGQNIGNAPSFSSSSGNISSRAKTTASVSWNPAPWTRTGEAGPDQQTPNIASVIQEIVSGPDWSNGNSLVIIITGTGERVAESYNGSNSGAPLLHVEYATGPVANRAPNVDAGSDQAVTLPSNTTLDATVIDDGLPSSALTTTWSQVSGPATVNVDNPYAVDTTVSFTAAGTYVLELTADDGELTNSDELTVTVYEEGTQPNTIEIRVEADYDDAEERSSMYLTSTDLELVYDRGNQTVGMRFNGVNIPQGAAITKAYIQFQAEESHSGATSVIIQGQNIDNAPTFSSSSGNISSRARTTAFVPWNPVPWTTGEAGPDQQTPNIALIIQQIVSREYWSSGNSLVIIITGTGERSAESYDGRPSGAPLLHVEYNSP